MLDSILPCGTETILIVDDEVEYADITSFHLESLGYNTVKSYDGLKALTMIEDNQKFDLVISDVVMPGKVNGFLLAQEVFNRDPNSRVLLASAYIKKNETVPDNPLITDLLKSLLKKPYTKSSLATAVRRTLDL